jgi:hypothetical protein
MNDTQIEQRVIEGFVNVFESLDGRIFFGGFKATEEEANHPGLPYVGDKRIACLRLQFVKGQGIVSREGAKPQSFRQNEQNLQNVNIVELLADIGPREDKFREVGRPRQKIHSMDECY